ncbi:MAG: single-stranded DNA-binding protein [Ignavibacteriaceae bacterium]|nr:single-stranded DNA-binding protein [Ignavibacteriaceae bacterium]
MAFSLNKIMLIGNLGRDAENRFTTNNLSVTNFTLATTNSYKGKDGNWVEETTWHNVVAYNLSDFMKEALKKGKKVYVEGRLTKRDYTDKDGIKRYVTEVRSDRIIPLEAGDKEPTVGPEETGAMPDVSSEENEDLPF